MGVHSVPGREEDVSGAADGAHPDGVRGDEDLAGVPGVGESGFANGICRGVHESKNGVQVGLVSAVAVFVLVCLYPDRRREGKRTASTDSNDAEKEGR